MILVGKSPTTLLKYPHRNIGRLIQPRDTSKISDTPRMGFLWAADNDAYSNFHEDRYVAMLEKCEGVAGCLYVTCPDVVGDAEATFDLYLKWAREILGRNLPLGYVAQDGASEGTIPWNGISALFIGGTTEFKLGQEASDLAREAKQRGTWVHMGRVNSVRRIEYAAAIGCDSIDGTSFSMFTDSRLPALAERAAMLEEGLPMNVPTRITLGSEWLVEGSNKAQLREFLQAYGIKLNDCYEIRFAKRWMEVRRWGTNDEGKRYVNDDGQFARREPATFRYRPGLTPVVF